MAKYYLDQAGYEALMQSEYAIGLLWSAIGNGAETGTSAAGQILVHEMG